MRILLLSAANNVHTVRWANALAERGNRVHLVYQPNHKPTLHMISKNVVLHSLKYSGDAGYFLNALELHRLCNRIEPDIVNAHYASGYGTLARLAKLRPLVLSVWGSDVYDFPYRNKLNLTILRRNLTYANQIASTSYCMADQVRRVLEGEDVDIEVTPFGVDTAVFSRKERHRNSTLICIGTVKALSPKYGICDLVRAVKILKENLESRGLSDISGRIVVRIYGDGPQKTK